MRSFCWITPWSKLPTKPLITLLPHISWPGFGLFAWLCGGLGSHLQAAVLLFCSLLIHLTCSHRRHCFIFFSPPPSSLFPCLSSLNLSSSCRSYASPVLCSAVLITVPFSCLETAEEMWRGREHLLTQSKHWSLLYKVYGKFSSQSKVQFVFQGVVFSC